jgi:hypothetical protein
MNDMQMRIYIFKSEANSSLMAFAGDIAGGPLPDKFRPWRAVGVIGADKDPPHNLPRGQIEAAIKSKGFQLWRLTPKEAGG